MAGVLVDDRSCGGAAGGQSEGEVDLWADSVGDAVGQLGLVLSLAFALKVVGLLFKVKIL
jgi:hypothetical protein